MSKELYCFSRVICDSVLKENASMSSRGILASLGVDYRDELKILITIAFQEKASKLFMECYG
jgi:predicted Mrr-cat superfamily restriction endonuclease